MIQGIKNWLYRLKISTRTAMSFFAIIFTALITSISSILLLQYAKNIDGRLTKYFNPAISSTKDIEFIINETGRYMYDWIYNPDDDKKLRLQKIIDKQYRKRKIFLIELCQQPELEKVRRRIAGIDADFSQVIEKEKRVMLLLKSNENYKDQERFNKAIELYNQIDLEIKAINMNVTELELMEIAVANKLGEKKYACYQTLSYLLLIMLFGLLVVSVASLYVTNKTIIKPVTQISELLGLVAKGQVVKYEVYQPRKDEIGAIQEATQELIMGFRAKADVANAIGKGDYDIHVPLSGKNDRLGKALIEMRNNLKSSMQKEHESKLSLEKYTFNLEKKNKELDQFAYITSHDLKSPLRAINNLSEWIKEDMGDKLSLESKDYFELLQGRVYRLEALINSLLRYSRAGRVNEDSENVSTRDLVFNILHRLNPPAELGVFFDENLPEIYGNRKDLDDVFFELIYNAVRHGGDNKNPVINITVKEQDNKYLFCIADNGQGIAPEFHDKIFTIFQTLESRDHLENIGAGLAIVKKILDENGEKIWIDSSPGNGSKFYFTWKI